MVSVDGRRTREIQSQPPHLPQNHPGCQNRTFVNQTPKGCGTPALRLIPRGGVNGDSRLVTSDVSVVGEAGRLLDVEAEHRIQKQGAAGRPDPGAILIEFDG